jgi:pimeloyl-ACP methyl ester carboxylesterase
MVRRIVSVIAICALLVVAPRAVAEDSFFDSSGVKIHYIVKGQGEPVVLIHGFSANILVQWEIPGIVSKLQSDYKVIALDNRGHGKSDKPHEPEKYGPEMVNDVLRLMDHLKIEKAHIVGYSMGGFLAGYLVANHPSRVLTATLGGAGWLKADDSRTEFMNVLAESLESGKGMGPLIEYLTPPGKPKPTDKELEVINQMVMAMNDRLALAACIRGLRRVSVTEGQLRANRVQALSLIGAEDPLKVGVDEMAQVMSNLRVEVLEGDHMTAFRNPKFVGGLKVFITDHAAEPAAAAGGGK